MNRSKRRERRGQGRESDTVRLRREDRKPRLVKPIVRKELLVLPIDDAELDSEALDREIREERERENAVFNRPQNRG